MDKEGGTYTVTVYIETLSGDIDLQNDTMKVIACEIPHDVGMDNTTVKNFQVGQNQPNPSNGNTIISYRLPENGKIVLTLTDSNGKLLYKTKVKAFSGDNTLEINTQNLSNGIYFYKVEYQGEHIVKKMTVQR